MFNKKEKRFVFLLQEDGFATANRILVDTKTGVNYLVVVHGEGTGVTPLLDANGKVVVSTRDELDELQYK